VSFDEWVEYAALQLPHALKGYATMQKMVDTLTEDSARDARNLLTTRFLPANCPIALGDPDEEKLGRFLAEGAVVPVDGNTFTIPSPLVHTLLMEKVARKTSASRRTNSFRLPDSKPWTSLPLFVAP